MSAACRERSVVRGARAVDPPPAMRAPDRMLGEVRIGGVEFAASQQSSLHRCAWRDSQSQSLPVSGCFHLPVPESRSSAPILSAKSVT